MNYEVSKGMVLSISVFFIVLCVIIAYVAIKKIRNNKILEFSENIKHLKIINQKYSFEEITNEYRIIRHNVNSLNKFRNINCFDIVMYYIKLNIENLEDDVRIALINKNIYEKYLKDVQKIDYKTNIEKIKEIGVKEEKFYKIEKKLFDKLIIKNVYDIVVNIIICYSSSQGRNHYSKSDIYDFLKLKYCYEEVQKRNEYELSSAYQRSLMSDSLRYDILKRDKFRCCICGASQSDGVQLEVDHIIPVSKGGKTEYSNLRTLCKRCNRGKKDKIE